MKIKLYQIMADNIFLLAKNSVSCDQFIFWYGWGIYLNETCIEQGIYLN